MSEILTVGPDHPAWAAYDDDDWNGATFSNWLGTLKDITVRLLPPKDLPQATLDGVVEAVTRCAKSATIIATIHVLKHGVSLCRMPGLPSEWPKGHVWVGFEEPNLRRTVSCATCRTEAGLKPRGKIEAG